MAWNWQLPDWPHFDYRSDKLEQAEKSLLFASGKLFGAFIHLSPEDSSSLKVQMISTEALRTSEIEGEYLDRRSLQLSIQRHFGIKGDNRKIPIKERSITDLMIDLYEHSGELLDHDTLYRWHHKLLHGQMSPEDIGCYRHRNDPMQIISGSLHDPQIHFEAPPSEIVMEEMTQFIEWFNQTSPGGTDPLSPLIRAGIVHVYFESIHPFEDGNGRIGRALSEKALIQSLGQPVMIGLSQVIHKDRQSYYNAFGKVNKSNDITEWLDYFSNVILEATTTTHEHIKFLIEKTKLFDKVQHRLNERQKKCLLRMFAEGLEGFVGGLSSENYRRITKTTRATATRDLSDLVSMGALVKSGERKSTRYYLNISHHQPKSL